MSTQPKESDLLLQSVDYFIEIFNQNFEAHNETQNSSIGVRKFSYGEAWEKAFKGIPEFANGVNIHSFLEDLIDWRRDKTLETLDAGERLNEGFEKLNIKKPKYFIECFKEVKHRTEFIKRATTGNLKWSEYLKDQFVKEIQTECIEFSLDEASKKEKEKELFYDRVNKIKETKAAVLEKYGYYIDSFFEEDSFKKEPDNLNTFFYDSERKFQNVQLYLVLHRILIDYFHLKKELIFLQDLVQGRLKDFSGNKDQAPCIQEEKNISLESFFESIHKYKKVMEILTSENLIQPNTYIWKDEMKGNKAFLAALIKHLHLQGYFKNGEKPSNNAIVEITKNSFQWHVSLDTVKRAKPDDFDFRFIPPASTIN